MKRFDRRASRRLLVVLAVVIVAGSIPLIYRLSHGHSTPAVPLAGSSAAHGSSGLAPNPAGGSGAPVSAGQGSLAMTAPLASPGSPTSRGGSAASNTPTVTTTPDLTTQTPQHAAIEPLSGAIPASSIASPSEPAPSLLADAQARLDAGHPLDARDRLNAALKSGQLSESQAATVKELMSKISQATVFGRQRFPEDPYGGEYVVQSGDSLSKIAAVHATTWEFIGRINGIDPKHLRAGATIKVIQGPFFAVVDKRKFTMDVYLGGLPGEKSSLYVTTYMVGLGRDDSTPTGTWLVEPQKKLRHPTYYSPRGEGIIAADDPKNPLGGYWIGLEGAEGDAKGKLSYGIHGTIEPDSIGKQSSMGCIRLRNDDIAVVYDLMVEGKSQVLVK